MLPDILRMGGISGQTFVLFVHDMRIRLAKVDDHFFQGLLLGRVGSMSLLLDIPFSVESLHNCISNWDSGNYKPMMISHLGLDTYVEETD